MLEKRTLILGVLLALFAMGAGCGAKKGDGAKKQAFKPGKLVKFEEPKLGFSLMKPDNVPVKVAGNVATLEAKGFPKVTVTVHKTQESSTGSTGSSGMGKYKRKVFVPMRKLVCQCDDMGKHEDLIKKICKSLKNTKAAPKKPSVKYDAPKITGKLKDAAAFNKALEALKPQILLCWKRAVASDPKHPAGHINFQLVYKKDGSQKQSNVTRTFNYPKDKLVTGCVQKLVESVKPQPDGGEVKLGWYLRFKLY